MTDEQIVLARRAVACEGWRWMPGMLAHAPDSGVEARVQEVGGGVLEVCLPDWYGVTWLAQRVVPDLTDPATLGCLLALVREAWGNTHLWVDVGVDPAMWSLTVYSIGWACIHGESPPPDIHAESEAEALVAALEAAP